MAFRAAISLLLEDCDPEQCFHRATREIIRVLGAWRSFDEMERESPRRAEVARLLRKIEGYNRNLMASLRRVGHNLEDLIHVYSPSPLLRPDPAFEHYRKADIHCIDDVPDSNGSGLYSRLTALREFCTASLNATGDKAKESFWLGVDSGGRTNVFKEHYGSAKWQLVYESASLFSSYQHLTTTVGGPLYQFCVAMHELATGCSDPDESAGLKGYVQFAVPRLRKVSTKYKELERLYLPNRLRPSVPWHRDLASEMRIQKLKYEIQALCDELARGPKRGRASTNG